MKINFLTSLCFSNFSIIPAAFVSFYLTEGVTCPSYDSCCGSGRRAGGARVRHVRAQLGAAPHGGVRHVPPALPPALPQAAAAAPAQEVQALRLVRHAHLLIHHC